MKIVELQDTEYIRISHEAQTSYGGDQNWFPKDKWMNRDYLIHVWGCGIIAISDLFLYLAKNDRMYATGATDVARASRQILDWKDYQAFVYYIYNTVALPLAGGMSGFAVASSVRRYCIKYQIPMTIAWKGFLDDQQMLRAIRKMLKENLPVILSIGPNTPIVFRKKGIPLYTLSDSQELIPSIHHNVSAHFVTVTGVIGLKHKQVLLKVASWGGEYYMDYREYRAYVQEEGDTLTSSLLYLSKEDGTLF